MATISGSYTSTIRVHSLTQFFSDSIFRGRNIQETREIFNLLADKVPRLNSLCPQLINEKSLQDILNYSRNFPNQSLGEGICQDSSKVFMLINREHCH